MKMPRTLDFELSGNNESFHGQDHHQLRKENSVADNVYGDFIVLRKKSIVSVEGVHLSATFR